MTIDLLVLGGGSGGIASATRAARHGAKVAVIEEEYLGGTCVNLGCVPKKIMYNAALIAEALQKASDYGFQTTSKNLNWQLLIEKRNNYIKKLRTSYAARFKELNISTLKGHGHFIASNQLKIDDQVYSAKHIIIATGSRPLLPKIPGIEHSIDSDGFFSLKAAPLKVAIIGSGYIAVELAGILHALGTETHILVRGGRLLSHFDSLLSETLLKSMAHQGLNIHLHCPLEQIILQKNQRKTLISEDRIISDLDCIIAAIGRQPNSNSLNLGAVGVSVDKQGFIEVDEYQNTSSPGIYALGDVTNAPALTPVAIAAGRKLADRLFGGQKEARLDYSYIPSVIFSHPPISSIGLSEEEALNKFGEAQIKIYQTTFNSMYEAMSDDKTPTAIKLVTLGSEEKIIGLHIFGRNADEILQGFAVAIKMGACKKDFDHTIAMHPTSAEEIVTLA